MSKNFKKIIGILGGMGPVASADTYVELTRLCQQKYGAVQDSDFPTVILYSLPLSEFSHEGFANNKIQQEQIIKQLIYGLRKLETAGADIIVIDCNTVHHFFEELRKAVKIPIVNLIATTVEYIKQLGYNKIAVLCSQTSRDLGLYTAPLKKLGVQVVNTSSNEQDFINDTILAVMAGKTGQRHIDGLDSIIKSFFKSGAQAVILGCTEISNLAKRLENQNQLIDSEKLAIEKSLDFARQT